MFPLPGVYSIGYEVLTVVVMKSSIFWDITLCIPLKFNTRFGGICLLHLQDRRISQAELSTCSMLVSCLANSSNVKMEVPCSFEASVDFQRTTRRYIPEDSTHQRIFFSQFLRSGKTVWPTLSDETFYIFLFIHIT
jgi:hypothetical protein